MERTQEAREFFAQDLFATAVTGIHIDYVKAQHARCSLQLQPQHRNANAQVMGGVLFTLADFTFAVATNDGGENRTVTANTQIQFLNAVRGQCLFAESHCLKWGRTSCVVEVTVTDELQTLVAKATAQGIRLPMRT